MNENQSITGNVIKNWLLTAKPIVENAKTDYTLVGIAQEAFEWIENLLSGYDVAQDVVDTALAENAALRARVARLQAVVDVARSIAVTDSIAKEHRNNPGKFVSNMWEIDGLYMEQDLIRLHAALKALEADGEGGE